MFRDQECGWSASPSICNEASTVARLCVQQGEAARQKEAADKAAAEKAAGSSAASATERGDASAATAAASAAAAAVGGCPCSTSCTCCIILVVFFNDLAGVEPDVDLLFIRIKQVIGVELPAQSLTALRTLARAVQVALVGGAQ